MSSEARSSIFQAPAILTRISYTKDRGLSLGFHTNELSDEDKIIAARYHGCFGFLLFKQNQFTEEEIPAGDATDEGKSPSQRLRSVLFVLWKQRGATGDFEGFYRDQLEAAINRVKRLLD